MLMSVIGKTFIDDEKMNLFGVSDLQILPSNRLTASMFEPKNRRYIIAGSVVWGKRNNLQCD